MQEDNQHVSPAFNPTDRVWSSLGAVSADDLRIDLGLSVDEVAKKAGIDPDAVRAAGKPGQAHSADVAFGAALRETAFSAMTEAAKLAAATCAMAKVRGASSPLIVEVPSFSEPIESAGGNEMPTALLNRIAEDFACCTKWYRDMIIPDVEVEFASCRFDSLSEEMHGAWLDALSKVAW